MLNDFGRHNRTAKTTALCRCGHHGRVCGESGDSDEIVSTHRFSRERIASVEPARAR